MTLLSLRTLCSILLFALLITLAYGASRSFGLAARLALWSIGLCSAGMFVGFLFGLPRLSVELDQAFARSAVRDANQGDKEPPASSTPAINGGSLPRPPDAMLEIADWLTKIIVGLGLVNLTTIPELLGRLATAIASDPCDIRRSFDMVIRPFGFTFWWRGGSCDHSVALAVAVCFPICGLMVGYLMTRLFVQTALLMGDKQARDALAPMAVSELMRTYRDKETEAQESSSGKTLPTAGPDPNKATVNELANLNVKYSTVDIADYAKRIRIKSEIAKQMYELAIARQVPKAWLAGRAGDGYIHVLASSILANPSAEDIEGLLRIGAGARMKHTKFQVAMACQKVIDASLVSSEEAARMDSLLTAYLADSDPPLRSLIELVQAMLRKPS